MKRFTDGMTEAQITYFKKHRRRIADSKALFYAKLFQTEPVPCRVFNNPPADLVSLFKEQPTEWLRLVMPIEGALSKTFAHLQDVMSDMAQQILPDYEKP